MPIPKHTLVACARAAHEANLAFCAAIGDPPLHPWDIASAWQRESCLAGVEGAIAGNTPEESHESWSKHKPEEGWVWGSVKDPDKKQHPCLVPYASLPAMQRMKDALYVAVVRAMASALGERVKDDPLKGLAS